MKCGSSRILASQHGVSGLGRKHHLLKAPPPRLVLRWTASSSSPPKAPVSNEKLMAKQIMTARAGCRETLYYAALQSDSSKDKVQMYHRVDPPPEIPSPRLVLEDALRALLPRGYPRSVEKGYAEYVKLQMTASLASSAVGVLSTQSLLYAMGLGAGAIPLAAALNWIIKDGIGQVGGIVFASVVNDRFDANPKRWKMVATISLDLSCGLELLAPLAPAYFLVIASLANVGKNVCFLSASASRAAIHNSFAKRENLADITAKAGSQFIVTSILGTGLGIALSTALGSSWMALAPICAGLSFIHISCNYLSLRHVCLNTLNAERAEMVLDRFWSQGRIPHPGEVSGEERFMWPAIYDTVAPSALKSGLPILRMGRALHEVASPLQLVRLARLFARDGYLLNARGRARDGTATVDVLMKEDASVEDVLRACIHAYYVRREASARGWKAPPPPSAWSQMTGRRTEEGLETWLLEMVEETHRALQQPVAHSPGPSEEETITRVDDIVGQVKQAGWLIDSVFFPHTQNRIAFEGAATDEAWVSVQKV
ncbi:hypothetical protein NSK_007886 [Nannochloropsis salina CCMP1776]|uniref:Vitamin B6 photo-protection and homoeostasis-domain-containing protein n=1 Tax=Nannochloropsis salina CCMP1776 TaxID=1027361 RepID=A0A4D9CVL1_9STRA|nr:hypothetical protein NSK_007886 [Nannochloropsis salina CCMP1776]|eukprot:TFJ80709.1 hypothetical protein NSK_007886 [Nannochloropsis salina CCMP1776]